MVNKSLKNEDNIERRPRGEIDLDSLGEDEPAEEIEDGEDSEGSTDESGIEESDEEDDAQEVLPDPAIEAQINEIRRENEWLQLQRLEEELLLQEEIARRDKALRALQRMEAERHGLIRQLELDMLKLAALGNVAEDDDEEGNHGSGGEN